MVFNKVEGMGEKGKACQSCSPHLSWSESLQLSCLACCLCLNFLILLHCFPVNILNRGEWGFYFQGFFFLLVITLKATTSKQILFVFACLF